MPWVRLPSLMLWLIHTNIFVSRKMCLICQIDTFRLFDACMNLCVVMLSYTFFLQVAFFAQTTSVCGQSIAAIATNCINNDISINMWIKEDNDVTIDVMRDYMRRLKERARSKYKLLCGWFINVPEVGVLLCTRSTLGNITY